MVGIIPLYAVGVIDEGALAGLPGFRKRMEWFLKNRPELARHLLSSEQEGCTRKVKRYLLGIPTRERLTRILQRVLDETEFLSPYGIRSLSRVHAAQPYTVHFGGADLRVQYLPGESESSMFGGNSNWRGPVWFPVNFLLIEALERYHHFYGDSFKIECPIGSSKFMNLAQVAAELTARLTRLFLQDEEGRRPCHGTDERYAKNPHWRDNVLFYEYFHGDNGRGLGASHQTGWTALAASLIRDAARDRQRPDSRD